MYRFKLFGLCFVLPEECLVKNRLQMSDMQIWSIKNQPAAGPLVSDNNHTGSTQGQHGSYMQLINKM